MKPYRSLLFVPGHKRDWIDKALNSEADAVIIDLEDSVPPQDKELARANAREALEAHGGSKGILIRPNALDTVFFGRDVAEVTHRNLTAFLLPKLFSRDDVVRFDALMSAAEIDHGIERGTVEVVPSLETAASINRVDEILTGPRVGGVMAAAAKDADVVAGGRLPLDRRRSGNAVPAEQSRGGCPLPQACGPSFWASGRRSGTWTGCGLSRRTTRAGLHRPSADPPLACPDRQRGVRAHRDAQGVLSKA